MTTGERTAGTWVVAIGGNALADPRDPLGLANQAETAAGVASAIVELAARGIRVLIVHGNGPQVGARLIQNEAAKGEVPPSTLDVCVAETQGQIGHLLSIAVTREFDKRSLAVPVAALLTHVVVDAADAEFERPDKPVGPVYTRREVDRLAATSEWEFAELPNEGWRRVVASPRPLRVVEQHAVNLLIDEGFCVVAGGGGGIPLVQTEAGMRGVEAVVDKDYTAERLATGCRAQRLILLTDVPGVALSFGSSAQRFLSTLSSDEARSNMERGEFAPGSMKPKVDACLEFLAHGGQEAVIAAAADAHPAFEGRAGTRVVP